MTQINIAIMIPYTLIKMNDIIADTHWAHYGFLELILSHCVKPGGDQATRSN